MSAAQMSQVHMHGRALASLLISCIVISSLTVACGPHYGQRPLPGEWVTIVRGDKVSALALKYNVPMDDIVEINGLHDSNRILVGQQLFIPRFGRDLSAGDLPYPSSPLPTSTDSETDQIALSERPGFRALRGASPYELRDVAWPLKLSLQGRVALSSGFGMRQGKPHRGLDVRAPLGTPVRAALGGEVTRSDTSRGGYGRVIYIRHTGGVETRYAHHHKNLVQVGQIVKVGDVIAEVGSSGRSTNPHLHFEVRIRGEAIDPLIILPALP